MAPNFGLALFFWGNEMQKILNVFVVNSLVLCLGFGAVAQQSVSAELLLDSPRATVSSEDIERYMQENLPKNANERASVLNRPDIFKEMVESLYVVRALAAEAEAAPGFDEEQARWSANMAYQRKLVHDYKRTYVAGLFQDVNWDVAALEHYNASPDKYMRQETVSASHILIRAQERSDEEALELVENVRSQIVDGADFAEMAKEFSEDGTARKGGKLGYFQKGKMTPEFEKVAFQLKKAGDISEPVKTPFGYHLIQLEDRKPAERIAFSEVKPRIIKSLKAAKGDQAWQDKVIQLRSAKDVVINEEALSALEKSSK